MKLDHWLMLEAVSNFDKEYIASAFENFYPDDRIRDVITTSAPVVQERPSEEQLVVEIVLRQPRLFNPRLNRYTVIQFFSNSGFRFTSGGIKPILNYWVINKKYNSILPLS